MIPIVTPEEMGAIDAAAPTPVEVLIERAGAAVARAALRLLGGGYGRRVVVVAGKGNNGADGRAAARWLGTRGVRCVVVDALDLPPVLPASDLVIDAAFGTGFRGAWTPPEVGSTPVLAVDVPSGVDGLTGAVQEALPAVATVTFAASKPGLVLPHGRWLTGPVEVVDIGLDVSRARAGLVTDDDVAGVLTPRPVGAHKWQTACRILAGSPTMTGAAVLAARGALRAGAGFVQAARPGVDPGQPLDPLDPLEAVGLALPSQGWGPDALAGLERIKALLLGPGLGLGPDSVAAITEVVAEAEVPLVLDADGLTAVVGNLDTVAARPQPTVLTPHDGEYARLMGHPPGPDRLGAARELAVRAKAVALLKGPTTVVAEPNGDVAVVTAGDARLATAGTGDVLAGVIVALMARGLGAFDAAWAGAHVHGRAASLGPVEGLVAGDLPDLVPAAVAAIRTAD
ncbi:MAG: NAD(P)H-hydrate dehydratase [Actinomycetia bacterium]|nr:NAD(P)H-hydrate dehydratase [Actinomycetes bacterium]